MEKVGLNEKNWYKEESLLSSKLSFDKLNDF